MCLRKWEMGSPGVTLAFLLLGGGPRLEQRPVTFVGIEELEVLELGGSICHGLQDG